MSTKQERKKNMTKTNNTLKTIVEQINDKFEGFVTARSKDSYVYLTLLGKRVDDCWELEELMEGVFEYVANEFDVDFSIVNYNKQTLVIEIYTY